MIATAICKRIWNVAIIVIIVAVLTLAVLMVGVRLIGLQPYTVISGSMEPTYHVGSMIYVKEVDPLKMQVDEPVTFYLNDNTVATHRIIEVIPDESNPNVMYYRTQGDANETPDGDPIRSDQIIGKPVFSIPYLGYLSVYIQTPPGRYVALGTCLAVLAAVFLVDLLKLIWKKDPPDTDNTTETEDSPETCEDDSPTQPLE